MKAPDFQRSLETFKSATTSVAAIYQRDLLDQKIRIAPLPEQRRIVARIEALQARSQKVREALEAVGPLLEQFRQSVLASAFRGDLTADWRVNHPNTEPASILLERIRQERRQKMEAANPKKKYVEPEPVDESDLPELPEEWCWANPEEVSWEITVGHVGKMKDEYCDSGIPFLRSLNVRRNRFDPTDIRYITREFHQQLSKSALSPGDVAIVRSGDPGTACVIPSELSTANCSDLVIVRLLSGYMPNLFAHFLNSPLGKEQVLGKQVGVAQQHFNIGAMRTIAIPIIPEPEQTIILQYLENAEKVQSSSVNTIKALIVETQSLNQSILAKAFRGELVPQDPNDEPASVLLERIRAEREAGEGAKTAKKKPMQTNEK